MFQDIETAIVGRATGVIVGAPVLTTFDIADFTEEGAPRVAVQVRWLGFVVDSQNNGAAQLQHRFEVSVLVDSARGLAEERTAAVVGLGVLVQRLLGFAVSPGRRLALASETPPPDFEGMALRLSIYFNVATVINAAAS